MGGVGGRGGGRGGVLCAHEGVVLGLEQQGGLGTGAVGRRAGKVGGKVQRAGTRVGRHK